MTWHYADREGRPIGPITEAEFDGLVASGVISGDTPVWKEGAPQPVKYSELALNANDRLPAAPGVAVKARCSECGHEFAQDEMVSLSGDWVCAECKPRYIQKLREGMPAGGAF